MTNQQLREEWEKQEYEHNYADRDGNVFVSELSDWWLSKFDAHKKAVREAGHKIWLDNKEKHICRFNDGEQTCECFLNGISAVLSLSELN